MAEAEQPQEPAAAYARHWGVIYRYVYSRVQNHEEAEDLTQEACARVLARHGAAAPPPGYLQAVALNLIRDRWRRRRSRGVLSPLEEAWLAPDDRDDPGSGHLDRIWLGELLRRLPEDQRMVLELRVIEGLSRAETARRLGRSEASVRGLQYRAIQTLRQLVHCVDRSVAHREAERP